MAQESSSIAFSIYHGGDFLREETFDRPIINLGKISTSNLRIDDVNVSRKHAVIERRGEGDWRLTDLGSTNGTSVNGRDITQSPLKNGDRILVGNTTLVVKLADAPAAAAAEAPGQQAETAEKPARQEEIRGLGQDSFYTQSASSEDAKPEEMALEIALLWGETVLAVEHFQRPRTIWVGEVEGCDFTLPEHALGHRAYPLVEAKGDRFALNLEHSGIEGDVLSGESVMPVAELAKDGQLEGNRLVIDQSVRARLRFGEFMLLVSWGRMPKRLGSNPLRNVDYLPHIFLSLSAIFHIAFLVFLSLMPEEQLRSRVDMSRQRDKLMEVMKVSEEEKEQQEKDEEEEEEEKDDEEGDGENEGEMEAEKVVEKEPEDDGLLNKLAKQRKENLKDKLSNMSPEERQDKAEEMAATAGAAKVMNEQTELMDSILDSNQDQMKVDGKSLSALTSKGGEKTTPLAGGGAVDPFGGTLSGGSGGFAGSKSVGSGGGSGGGGSKGVVDDLDKEDSGRDVDDVDMKDRDAEPVAIASKAEVSGKLDRETVQSIIRRNLSGIKWCYQDALQAAPDLQGKITLAFTILPNGTVSNPKARNPDIEDKSLLTCIQNKMGRWRFPSPKEGGVVKVTYPLILKTRK